MRDIRELVRRNIQLLREGAIVVEDGWDIMKEYVHLYPELVSHQPKTIPMQLTPEQRASAVKSTAKLPPRPKKTQKKETSPASTDTKVIDKSENRAYIDVQEILPRVSADEAAVLRQLEGGKQPVDRMIDETQLPAGRVLSALTLLEVKGFVKRLPARYYELAKK